MCQLSAHLPQDRRLSLAQGAPLPNRACGSALFADISGFTASAEALVNILHYNLGRYWQARECMEAALKIARGLQATRLEAVILINLGTQLSQAGDLASASAINTQAFVVTQMYGLNDMQAYALVNQGYSLVALGSLPEAQAAFRQAIDIRRSQAVPALAMEAQAGSGNPSGR